ncbi:hypothetical protein QTP88_001706 [Uroleucon formosanum]
MSLSNNDEIRISVLNMDSYTLPCESYIYIEGKVNKPSDAAGEVRFSNNGLAFLFSEMRYKINGIEIQKLKSPGVSSCLKAYCSYTPNDLNALKNSAWNSAMDSEDNKNFMSNNVFTGCIPLKHLFGFCEDYKKILLNCNQQLILNRASTDLEAIHVVGEGATAAVDKNKKITIELTKLLYDAKQGGTFKSGRWGSITSPDLCFVTTDSSNMPLKANRRILQEFPRSQHLPVQVDIGLNLTRVSKPKLNRWNVRKADWAKYTTYMEENINRIEPIPLNYDRFTKLIKMAAGKAMPRGHRQDYIPCWSKECDKLLNEYEQTQSDVTADRLISLLDEERRQRWVKVMEEMDFSHSSRKSWDLLRKLGSAQPTRKEHGITANAVANNCEESSALMNDFIEEEVHLALKNVKNGKAAGVDGILPKFIKNLGPRSRLWLARFFTSVANKGTLPKAWCEAKVVAILKPNKPGNDPRNYRPISLLSVVYKLFERLLLRRMSPLLDRRIPMEQAGFRSGRNCCKQVLALTTYVENGFQNKLKSGAVFLDLSAAYDTVWKRSLLLKLAKNLRCKATLRLLEQILSDRSFKVNMNGETSQKRILQNGLPQGSVLSPTLFNVYTADIETLNKDLDTLQNYFKNWHLNLNANKTTAVAFHLNNREANRELKLKIGGVNIANEECPRYLGIKLDRALTFRQQLETTKNKIKSRNNIISKLAETSWGCSAGTLRTSVLSLVYSVAEYYAPVWTRSAHCNKIDVQLNAAMRIVTGTVRSTPTQWLPVLSTLALRKSVDKQLHKILSIKLKRTLNCLSMTT